MSAIIRLISVPIWFVRCH